MTERISVTDETVYTKLAAARTLAAQQAQRADEAEAKLSLATCDKWQARDERDAALAQAAELRRALEDARGVMQECVKDTVGTPTEAWFMAQVRKIDAALAITPGEALERVKRQARIAALEALPCERAARYGKECRLVKAQPCPRCKALAEARKESA